MLNTIQSLLFVGLLAVVGSEFFAITDYGKYDIDRIPFDLRPVKDLVGVWHLTATRGKQPSVMLPPDIIDFGINPIPKFGSRALNFTMHYYDRITAKEHQTDYGYIPVKNATRFDPRWNCAILTTSSGGYSIMEQGLVAKGPEVRTHLKQFLKRTFSMGGDTPGLMVESLERLIRVTGPQTMDMTIQTITSHGNDDYTAEYVRAKSS